MEEIHKLIEAEMAKIIGTLQDKYKIKLSEVKKIQYGITYDARMDGENQKGIFTIYFSPKKETFNITPNQKLSNEVAYIIKETFDARDLNLADCKKDSINANSKEDMEYDELKEYYSILKKYENDDFDFIEFAEKLAGKDKSNKDFLLQNKYNFCELEKAYVKIMSKYLEDNYAR